MSSRGARASVNGHEWRTFSQNGEDGLIDYILAQTGTTAQLGVEFGFHPHQCNSLRLLIDGAQAVLMDGDTENCDLARRVFTRLDLDAQVVNAFITREIVNEAIGAAVDGRKVDVLSIDIDGNDYWVWAAVDCIRPRLIVVEYNASFGHTASITVPYEPDFHRMAKHGSGFYHGASLSALTKLGREKGYRLVGCDSHGVNAFFVRGELGPGLGTCSPRDAFYPHLGRLRRGYREEQQWQMVEKMPFVEV